MNTSDAQVRPLTIVVVGNGESTHISTRTQWFAKRGHKVFLLTASPSPSGIPGVAEVDLGAQPLVSGGAWLLGLARRARYQARTCLELFRLRGEATRGKVIRQPITSRERSRGRLLESLYVLLTAIDFLRVLRRCKPDVVHVYYAYGLYAWLTGLFGCRPLVVTVEGSDVLFEEHGIKSANGKWLTVQLLRQADCITTQAKFMEDAVNRLCGFRREAERIVWGVSLDLFRRRDASALRRDLGLEPEARVILSPKILQPFYRIHLIVEAMVIVRQHCPHAVLVVGEYGAEPRYREQLAKLVTEHDLGEHVRFAGVVPHEDMPDYYSLAELSIAIPSSDGIPHALLESLACETPQILSRLSRYEEIVRHEESAYFVDPNPEAIAAAIIRLLDDTVLRTRIVERGRAVVVREANLDEQAARVERRLRELAAATPPRSLRMAALFSGAVNAVRAVSLRQPG